MKFNICIIEPRGYPHSAAFTELGELVGYGLQDLGHSVSFATNEFSNDARNIIIGCHLLDSEHGDRVPESSIVINTEQVVDDDTHWISNIYQWACRYETWDYSERNLQKLREVGARNPKLLRIGFHEKLARIPKPGGQDIDVLFYGSVGERRLKAINLLKASGCKVVAVFNAYGKQRDKLIARSKVVLNLHHYNSRIFEIVRVFYLMTNSKAVVSEVGEDTAIDPVYLKGIFPSRYENLTDSCRQLLADADLRREQEARALVAISKIPQHVLLEPLLD